MPPCASRSKLEFTFDSYPRKSGVQDLNLFKSDFGSENACVKDKIRTFPVFPSCLAALGSSIQNSRFGEHKPIELHPCSRIELLPVMMITIYYNLLQFITIYFLPVRRCLATFRSPFSGPFFQQPLLSRLCDCFPLLPLCRRPRRLARRPTHRPLHRLCSQL